MLGATRWLALGFMIMALTIPALAIPALPAGAVPPPPQQGAGDMSLIPVKGLLCGGGWHWSFAYFKCIRNRHHCPSGQHWISLLKTCVSL